MTFLLRKNFYLCSCNLSFIVGWSSDSPLVVSVVTTDGPVVTTGGPVLTTGGARTRHRWSLYAQPVMSCRGWTVSRP